MAPRPARIAGVKASLATVAIALLLLGAACSGDDGGDDGSSGSSPDGTEAPAGEDLESYDTVAALNDALSGGGVDCPLEYDGLTDDDGNEYSTCTIDGTQAFLYIWSDPASVGLIVAPEGAEPPPAVAYGANWTIELTPPTAATASAIADAAGGATTDA
jgi:hypothetical protein